MPATPARHLHDGSAQLIRRLASQTVYTGRLLSVKRERWRFGEMPPVDREIVQHPGSVVIVPIVDSRHLLLVRQFRVSIRERLWELPAGTREAGESLSCCAHRELVEETGYMAHCMKKIARFLPSPGFCTETMHLFVGWGLVTGARRAADDEPMFTRIVSFRETLSMIKRGIIVDAKTIIGVMLAYPSRDHLLV